MTSPEQRISDADVEREDVEIQLLLEAIYQLYGYDFRSYTKASIRRRVMHRLSLSRLPTITRMTDRLLHDRAFFTALLNDLTVNVTEMFRDPGFYRTFREQVVPTLKTYPFIKIWHAGCATGEEIYSMAILLHEEGLYERSMLYATDIDQNVLAQARKAIYPVEVMRQYSENYRQAGGKASLSDYYTARYNNVILDQQLKRNIVFADHDLATDQVFGEMNVIVCRNVLIYFDRTLQQRVFKLFRDSLDMGGVLCLGSKESLRFSGCESAFTPIDTSMNIYQKRQLVS